MPPELILLVDDEPSITQLARIYLEQSGYRIAEAADGQSALEAAKQRPALIVMDAILPKLDGFDVCRRLRAAGDQVPIIMLMAQEEDIDKILALELGADDYLTKPFNPRELVARVRAILRRSELRQQADERPLHRGDLTIDPASREVRLASQTLHLRAQEFDLLLTLAEQPGRVFTREQLLQTAWGLDYHGQTRTVDVHIANLRKKLNGGGIKIETVTGVGYKLSLAATGGE